MAVTGRPSISDVKNLDVRSIALAVSNIRQRIEALEGALAALQLIGGGASSAELASLQAQINGLVLADGTVTRVDATVPSIMSVAGVPITTRGTIAISLADQPASMVFAGPLSGVDAEPVFRALQWDYDLPLFSSAPSTSSGIDGNELVLVESYGQFLWTTTQDIANLVPAPTGVAFRAGGNTFTGEQTVTPVALADGATINTDASLSNSFTVTLGGNRTLADPTNTLDGVILQWKIKQDGTGSRTLAYGSKFKWVGGSVPVLTATAGARDFIVAQYYADEDILVCNILRGLA